MKKLLALLLALMMVLTLTLVSCNKDKENEDNSDGLDFNFDDPTNKPTDENGSEKPTDQNGNKETDASDFSRYANSVCSIFLLRKIDIRAAPIRYSFSSI